MLTDEGGIALAVAVEGANRHDLRLLVGGFGGGGGASLFLRRRGDGLLEAALVALEAAYNLQPVREERELEGEKLRAPHLSGRQEEEAK